MPQGRAQADQRRAQQSADESRQCQKKIRRAHGHQRESENRRAVAHHRVGHHAEWHLPEPDNHLLG
jgi:hypothetical protein